MTDTISDYDELMACVEADEVHIGENVRFGTGVRIAAIEGRARRVSIGDDVYLGNDVLVLAPEFVIGDYGTVHRSCRLTGYQPLTIGHNFWCDQNCILNCTDRLQIGNNVGVGAYSQLWTHIRYGDTLIGCRFDSTEPMTIHDDVWFVGHCLVSPIEARSRSVAMLGSTIVRDMEENHVYGGSPAKDLTSKIGEAYVDVKIEERLKELTRRIAEFFSGRPSRDRDAVAVITEWPSNLDNGITYFNVSDRSYTKRRTAIEIELMRFLLPTAKFLPR